MTTLIPRQWALRRRVSAVQPREQSQPRALVHIWCGECGRSLDWAQPEFVARHPNPRCWACVCALAQAQDREDAERARLEVIGEATARELYRIAGPQRGALR